MVTFLIIAAVAFYVGFVLMEGQGGGSFMIFLVLVLIGAGVARVVGGYVPLEEVQKNVTELVPYDAKGEIYVTGNEYSQFAKVRHEDGSVSTVILPQSYEVRIVEDEKVDFGRIAEIYEESDNDHWLAYFGFEPQGSLIGLKLTVPAGSVQR